MATAKEHLFFYFLGNSESCHLIFTRSVMSFGVSCLIILANEEEKQKELIIGNSLQLIVGPLLSVAHVCSVIEEMKAAPVNTLNPQRTAMVVADFLKVSYEFSLSLSAPPPPLSLLVHCLIGI